MVETATERWGDEFSAEPPTPTRPDEISRKEESCQAAKGGGKLARWKSNNRTFAFGEKLTL